MHSRSSAGPLPSAGAAPLERTALSLAAAAFSRNRGEDAAPRMDRSVFGENSKASGRARPSFGVRHCFRSDCMAHVVGEAQLARELASESPMRRTWLTAATMLISPLIVAFSEPSSTSHLHRVTRPSKRVGGSPIIPLSHPRNAPRRVEQLHVRLLHRCAASAREAWRVAVRRERQPRDG